MSLTFGAATTDRIACGTGSAISGLAEWTYCAWVYPTTFTSLRAIYSRSDINYLRLNGTAGYIQILRGYSTTNMNYIASSGALSLNTWNFAAGRMTTARTGNLYTGTLSAPATETTYSTATAGVGTLQADDQFSGGIVANIGNLQTLSRAWQGTIAMVSIWSYALPLADIIEQQFRPQPLPGCVAFWRLGGKHGIGEQRDLTRHANHGRVTGATISFNEPALYWPPVRRMFYVPEIAAYWSQLGDRTARKEVYGDRTGGKF